jgi:hypothetical protein
VELLMMPRDLRMACTPTKYMICGTATSAKRHRWMGSFCQQYSTTVSGINRPGLSPRCQADDHPVSTKLFGAHQEARSTVSDPEGVALESCCCCSACWPILGWLRCWHWCGCRGLPGRCIKLKVNGHNELAC